MIDSLVHLAQAAEPGLVEKLGQTAQNLGNYFHVDTPLLIAQGLNFLIVAVLLWKFAFKPTMEAMEERQRKIRDGLQYAEEMKARLADAERQSAETLRHASEEAAKVVAQARENAKDYLEKQNQEAVKHAEQIIAKAQAAMVQERKQMMADIRTEVAQLVVDASAKVLDRELSSDEKGRFSEAASKELYANN